MMKPNNMEETNIKIGSKRYKVKVAEDPKDQEDGLQNVSELPENEGMLFIFDKPQEVDFWMKDTEIPLDIVFIDEELTVISVKQGIPGSEEFISENNTNFVLEVNQNSGIKKGDDLEFSPDSELNEDKMAVLDSEGNPQMLLEGNERIFSRVHTKAIIKFAKKAYSTKSENDYKNLGKKIFKFLQIQEETPNEYVETREK